MDYQETLDYIYSYIDYEVAARPVYSPENYDLRRMDELLARLGNPHLKAKSVHIAGTKGKGSVAAMMASVLKTSGYVTGLYTSPHLSFLNERIRVDDRLISDDELVSLVEKLKPDIEAVDQKATYGHLTTFEVMTAIAFDYFTVKGAEFQVLEVGLGGRLDATNVIQPEVCVITSISYDHTEVLGESLAEIAAQKAGIIKPGSIVIVSPQLDEAKKIVEDACYERGARLVRVGSDVAWHSLRYDSDRQQFRVNGRLGSYRISMPLLGRFQLENAAVAVAALEVLVEKGFSISPDSIVDGLERVKWQGRFQILSHNPLLVVDGAHNPDSAHKLMESLEQYLDFDRAILVIGTSFDKNIAGIVSELSPFFDKVIVTRSRHPRAAEQLTVVDEFARHGVAVQVVDDVPSALSVSLALAGERDLICVTGSLFVAAEAIEQASIRGSLLEKS
ncbi:bifunctional folylpolyglutamate synthase/dihydrofolate synthase [Chloroflexota bacterium]